MLASHPINYRATDGVYQAIDDHLVADPARGGGLTNAANSWRAHFGSAQQVMSIDTSKGSIGVAPVGAANVAPRKSSDGTRVVYPNAWQQADLVYAMTETGVEQSVMIKSRTAGSSFAFTTESGSAGNVLARRNVNANPSAVQGEDGSVSLAGSMVIQQPMVLDARGTPVDAAHAKVTATAGRLMVSLDPAWLAAQPDSAFPINLDPTFAPGPSTVRAFKSDGYSCSGCQVQFGNSQDGGSTYWRSVAHYPYESLFGDEIVGVQINTGWQAGTQNDYGMHVYWASSYSYYGANGHPTALASGIPGATTGVISGSGLTNQIKSWVNGRVSGGAFGFIGKEQAGLYTYQRYDTRLAVSYWQPPSAPSGVGFKSAAPTTPGCTGGTIDGSQASSWKAKLNAPTSRNMYATYQYWDSATSSVKHTVKSGTYPLGSTNSLAWVVSFGPNVFRDGHTYGFHVQGYDGVKAGPWSGTCSFLVKNPVANAPTSPGFGPVTPPGVDCGSTVRGDQPIVIEASIKNPAPTTNQVRATFTVSYTDAGGTAHTQTYTTAYTSAATSWAQATIPANTNPTGFKIPNGTTFTWSVVSQVKSDGKLSGPTQCGGVTSSGQIPAPSITADDDVAGGIASVADTAAFTFSDTNDDPSTGVIEYVYSFNTVLPDLEDLQCGDVADIATGHLSGLTCASDQTGDDGDPDNGDGAGGNEAWNTVNLIVPSTAFSLTVWAIDATGTVSPATTVSYTAIDVPLGDETHLWQTDQVDPSTAPSTVADVLDPNDQLPISITANTSGSSWASGTDGAPWQLSPGSSGTALHFDGAQGVATAAAAAVPLATADNHWDATDDFSVQVWVRPTAPSTPLWNIAAAQDGAQHSGFLLGMSNGYWMFCMPHSQDQPGPGYNGDCALVPLQTGYVGQWVLLMGVWDATGGKILLHVATGLSSDPNASPPSVATGSTPHTESAPAIGAFTVGRAQAWGQPAGYWAGDIEDPASYAGVANADQVTSLAANGPYNPNNQ